MQPLPEKLPAFDQAQLDRRFLTELDRLLQAEVFDSYQDWASAVGVSPNYVAAIARGTYHCNLALLYNTLRHYPATDLSFVLFGAAASSRPEPVVAPVRQRGRPPGPPAPPPRPRGRPPRNMTAA